MECTNNWQFSFLFWFLFIFSQRVTWCKCGNWASTKRLTVIGTKRTKSSSTKLPFELNHTADLRVNGQWYTAYRFPPWHDWYWYKTQFKISWSAGRPIILGTFLNRLLWHWHPAKLLPEKAICMVSKGYLAMDSQKVALPANRKADA